MSDHISFLAVSLAADFHSCLVCNSGNEIINEALVARVQQRKAHEADIVRRIKMKLEKIKLRQRRLGKDIELTDHYQGWLSFVMSYYHVIISCFVMIKILWDKQQKLLFQRWFYIAFTSKFCSNYTKLALLTVSYGCWL